jgi:hypothetical protein
VAAGGLVSPDLSGVKTFKAHAVIREAGMGVQDREVRVDFAKGVMEVYRAGGETYVTWFDGKEAYSYREGGKVVVRRTHGGYMSLGEARRFVGRFGAWTQSGPKRDAAADVEAGGTKLAAYQVARWPLVGNKPVTLWVDGSGRPARARGKTGDGGTMEYEAEWDGAAEMPAGLPAGARVVDAEVLAGEAFPLEKAAFRTEAASHVLAVHSARRDREGNYHVVVSARPTEAARPLAKGSPPPNFLARADGEKAKSVTVVGSQYVGGMTVRRLVVVPGGKARDGVCEFDTTMLLWGEITQALQERRMSINGMPHVGVKAVAGGSFEEELRRTYDEVAAQGGVMDGGVVMSVQGTIPNDVPAAVVGWEGFREGVVKRMK